MSTVAAVLTLACADRPGIVAAVAGFLADSGCNITSSAQFGDPDHQRFFMRVSFVAPTQSIDALRAAFAATANRFALRWTLVDATLPMPTLVMVSGFGHCLNDLLYRTSIGALPVTITAIVSNHAAMAPVAAVHGIPFHEIPVAKADKASAEAALRDVVDATGSELVVLARYMQILTEQFCTDMRGRIINIHHSFLPSFKGAKPYTQAHDRGVKLIGATAHYVTGDLDEGPIIDQDVIRIDHAMSPADLAAAGRDVESLVLARAVKWHAEHRVMLNGSKTVVFR